jgi:glycosyltransferase involved in cell wall biosynthesis
MSTRRDGPRLRVLLVLGTSTGGIGQHVRSLVDRLVRQGHHVVVCGPAETEELFGFTATGARFIPTAIGTRLGPQDLAVARRLRGWVRGADVVHAHGFRAGLVALAAGAGRRPAGRRRPPLVVTWHNQVLATGLAGAVMHSAEAVVARGATVSLGASADLVRQAQRWGGQARLGAVAAPRPEPVMRDRASVRDELAVGASPVVLAVGRLHPQKDYPTMVRALAELASRPAAPVLVVAGDGPDEESVRALAAELGVEVRLLGRRQDVSDLMGAADLLVVSSVWEARALVVQEAMQLGLPVVATDVGGLPELVGDDALLVQRREPHALATAVAQVLDHPAEAAARAERARARAQSWPDEDAVAAQVEGVYREVVDRPELEAR